MGWQDRDYNQKRPNDDSVDEEPSFDDVSDVEGEDDDSIADPEAPDASDIGDDDDGPAQIACPNCRRMIAEDAEQCPRCGHFILDEELSDRRPTWIWVGLILALVVAITWAFLG